jgi:hypothetical protein
MGCQGDTVNYQVLVFGEGTAIIFLEQPESFGVCLDDSVSLMVYAAGYPDLNFQWQKNGENIENATDSIFTILSAQFEDEADYRCIVSNDFGSDTTDPAHLSVDELIPSYIQGPNYVSEFEVADYTLPYTEGHVYEFVVEGGNIIGTEQNGITVQWGASGYGLISGLESVENGCIGDWVDLTIYIGTTATSELPALKPQLYPNPVKNFVTIRLKGKHSFLLFDLVGNIVLEEEFEDQGSFSLDDLDQGMYLYKLDGYTGRLIK